MPAFLCSGPSAVGASERGVVLRRGVLIGLCLLALPAAGRAQTTGTIIGRVRDAGSREPLAGARVAVPHLGLGALTAADGRFVLAAVPAGQRELQVELLGYQTVVVEAVQIRPGRVAEVEVELHIAALELEGVTVEAQRIRLIEPEISLTHQVVAGRELRELPVDRIQEAIELAPGVSDGHFRGGRIGQESYLVDGLEVKNPVESSSQGAALELSPTALEEVEVITGGFGAAYGSALSGVVSYVTRRGDPEHWRGAASFLTDHWAPASLLRGFAGISASAGGPVPFLGSGSTLFLDVLLQGQLDAEPRARGLTCLRPEDAEPDLAAEIQSLAGDAVFSRLYCPYSSAMLPHQRGEKLLGFARLDRPLGAGATLAATYLTNRRQRQLYTPEFKYNALYQLGQRTEGQLATLTLDWTRHGQGRAYHGTARVAAMRLERYLGVVDPWTFGERWQVGGMGWADYRFLGSSFVRQPLNEQLAAGVAVPGYAAPGGSTGSPYGPAGVGIFFTEGTPDMASWTRSEFLAGDLAGELVTAAGHLLRAGGSARFHRVESYERVLAYLAGSAPNYARFYPASVTGFVETQLQAADDVILHFGARLEGFRSGLQFVRDRGNFLAPVAETEWRLSFMPRIGVSLPVPGSAGRMSFRFNYGRVAQPPDFRFFLDTAVGDSLRTDIRRQGNPELGFERGSAYELGLTRLLGEGVALSLTAFRKELTNLVTGSLQFSGYAAGQFTTGDFGTVQGLELSVRGGWPVLRLQAAYALQKATGVTSTALSDSIAAPDERRLEFPLAFDRRHVADLALFAGRAAGGERWRWAGSMIASLKSGFPLERRVAGGEPAESAARPTYLPWTAAVDLRLSRELGALPGCGGCAWRVVADGRNILGRENVIALRRDTGGLAPSLERVRETAAGLPPDQEPIPRESPRYSQIIDLNQDGLITPAELAIARFAAALDRHDPSLFFGAPRQVRLGFEVSF